MKEAARYIYNERCVTRFRAIRKKWITSSTTPKEDGHPRYRATEIVKQSERLENICANLPNSSQNIGEVWQEYAEEIGIYIRERSRIPLLPR